ncbi:MAG: VOC family protein [Mucilaginibacter sp.]|nr:VOC family protein [Mucilaginibacter sp.]
MENLKIPEGYQRIMPYLIVENAAEFFNFTKNVFGAVEKYKAMRTETLIMHAEISIGGSVIMFADATTEHPKQTAGFFIYVDNCDAVYEKALANGATTVTAPADQSYGRSAGIRDPFGNTWWLTSA